MTARIWYYATSVVTLLRGVRNWPSVLAACLGLRTARPFLVELRASTLRFYARGALDVWIIKETCLDRDYEADVDLADGWIIVDIGAGLGEFSVWAARGRPHARVYAYEPFPESLALLEANATLNRLANITAFARAVGGGGARRHLYTGAAEAAQHRTLPEGAVDGPDLLDVPGTGLDRIVEELALPRVDFLKLDCEGAEYEILFGAAPATLGRVRHIAMEVHAGVTTHQPDDLARFLEAHGFETRLRPNPARRELSFLYARRRP